MEDAAIIPGSHAPDELEILPRTPGLRPALVTRLGKLITGGRWADSGPEPLKAIGTASREAQSQMDESSAHVSNLRWPGTDRSACSKGTGTCESDLGPPYTDLVQGHLIHHLHV